MNKLINLTMINKNIFLSFIFLCLLMPFFYSCSRKCMEIKNQVDADSDFKKNYSEIPIWVKRIPLDESGEYIYSVGYSGPAFYYKDALENAKKQAIIELAKSIKVVVKEEMFDIMVNGKNSFNNKEQIVSISESIVNSAVKYSEILEVWQDKYGVVGEKGSVYVLSRIKRDSLKNEIDKEIKR